MLHHAEYHRNISCIYLQTEATSARSVATSQISAFNMVFMYFNILPVQYIIHLIANVLTVEYNPINCICNNKYLFSSAPAICYGLYKPSSGQVTYKGID